MRAQWSGCAIMYPLVAASHLACAPLSVAHWCARYPKRSAAPVSHSRALTRVIDCTLFRCAQVESTRHESEYADNVGHAATFKSKAVTTVEEWLWRYELEYAVVAFAGAASEDADVLMQRRLVCGVMTASEEPPCAAVTVLPNVDLNITWLLQRLTKV